MITVRNVTAKYGRFTTSCWHCKKRYENNEKLCQADKPCDVLHMQTDVLDTVWITPVCPEYDRHETDNTVKASLPIPLTLDILMLLDVLNEKPEGHKYVTKHLLEHLRRNGLWK